MISNPVLYRRANRLLGIAVIFSLIVHLAGVATYLYVQGRIPWLQPPREKPEQPVVLSTAMRVSRISVPELSHALSPGRNSAPQARPEVRVQPQPENPPQQPRSVNSVARKAIPQAVRRELAVTTPSAAPMAPRPQPATAAAREANPSRPETVAEMLAREQPVYEREIERMRQNSPLSTATISPRPASAFRKAYFNISGIDRNLDRFEGLVTPTRTWNENGLRCHYADYDIEYQYGGTDKGAIPWPLCYAPALDPMSLPDGTPAPNGTPVPTVDLYPRPGYVLPQGTYLTPFLNLLYRRAAT
jgi:hypothetical protein